MQAVFLRLVRRRQRGRHLFLHQRAGDIRAPEPGAAADGNLWRQRRGRSAVRLLDHVRRYRVPCAVRGRAGRTAVGVVRVMRVGLLGSRCDAWLAYPFARSLGELYVLHAALGHRPGDVRPARQRRAAVALVRRAPGPRRRRARLRLEPGRRRAAARHRALGERIPPSAGAGATAVSPRPSVAARARCRDSCCCARIRQRLGSTRTARPQPPPAEAAATSGATLAVALRSRTLWCLALGSACLWFSIQAVTSQITIFLEREAGFAPVRATRLVFADLRAQLLRQVPVRRRQRLVPQAPGDAAGEPDAPRRLPAAVRHRAGWTAAGRPIPAGSPSSRSCSASASAAASR